MTGVLACANRSYAQYIEALGPKLAPMVADFAGHIKAGHLWLAKDDTCAMLGYIVFYPITGKMMLENVAVNPGASGKGIGKELIRFCEDQARREGLDVVRLYTNEKMTDNLSIYPHLGYQEVERRFEHGYARVFFEKRLG